MWVSATFYRFRMYLTHSHNGIREGLESPPKAGPLSDEEGLWGEAERQVLARLRSLLWEVAWLRRVGGFLLAYPGGLKGATSHLASSKESLISFPSSKLVSAFIQ